MKIEFIIKESIVDNLSHDLKDMIRKSEIEYPGIKGILSDLTKEKIYINNIEEMDRFTIENGFLLNYFYGWQLEYIEDIKNKFNNNWEFRTYHTGYNIPVYPNNDIFSLIYLHSTGFTKKNLLFKIQEYSLYRCSDERNVFLGLSCTKGTTLYNLYLDEYLKLHPRDWDKISGKDEFIFKISNITNVNRIACKDAKKFFNKEKIDMREIPEIKSELPISKRFSNIQPDNVQNDILNQKEKEAKERINKARKIHNISPSNIEQSNRFKKLEFESLQKSILNIIKECLIKSMINGNNNK